MAKVQVGQIVKRDENGNFINTPLPINRDSKDTKNIDEALLNFKKFLERKHGGNKSYAKV